MPLHYKRYTMIRINAFAITHYILSLCASKLIKLFLTSQDVNDNFAAYNHAFNNCETKIINTDGHSNDFRLSLGGRCHALYSSVLRSHIINSIFIITSCQPLWRTHKLFRRAEKRENFYSIKLLYRFVDAEKCNMHDSGRANFMPKINRIFERMKFASA